MRHFICIAAFLIVAFCTACSGGGAAPSDTDRVRALVKDEIALLAAGINRRDAVSASLPVSALFTMGDNVQVRFPYGSGAGTGIGWFRTFFANVFTYNANVAFTAELTGDFTVDGTTATAFVTTSFNSTRIDLVPPEAWAAGPFVDYFIFSREGNTWRLIKWAEGPEHMQGEGESL